MEKRELPEGWEWSNLGSIGKIISGVSYKAEEAIYQPSEHFLPILRANNINGNLNFDDLIFVPKERVAKEQCIKNGDIVIAMSSGSKSVVGKSAQAKEDFKGSFGAFCAVFRCNDDVDKKYIGYFFQTPNYRNLISHSSRGININNLRKESIRSIKIPLPPLPVQRRIVEILDQADALRRLRTQADSETQKLLQSVFYEMFGDPVRNEKEYPIMPLKKLCLNITDGKHGDCKNLENSGYFFISAKDIVNGKIDYSNSRQITKEDYFEVNKRVKFEIGDILITNSGSIGKIAIADDILKTSHTTFQKSVAIIKIDKNLTKSKYLVSFLEFNKNKLLNQSSGSSQKNLLLRDINNFKINLPPLDLQQQYTNVVNNFDIIREIQKVSEKEINLLIDCLMAKAFSGEFN